MAPAYLKGASPVRFRRAALATLVALAVLPGAAQAADPLNDDYESPLTANGPGTVFADNSPVEWKIGPGAPAYPFGDSLGTIDEADNQTGGMGDTSNTPEDLSCDAPAVSMNKTVWYYVFPDVSGWVQTRTSGGDAVIRLITVTSGSGVTGGNNTPIFSDSVCADDPSDENNEELFAGVVGGANRRYAIQVGVFGAFGTWGGGTHLTRITFFRDQDLDGFFDTSDRCDTASNPNGLQGCPDTDSDGVANVDDRCPTTRGLATLRGCADGDGDGVADPDDRCRSQNARARDVNRDGCLDATAIRRLDRTVLEDFGGFATAFTYKITKFSIVGVPKGARISAKCLKPKRRGKRRSCGSQTISKATLSGSSGPKAQAAKTRKLKRFIGKRLRRGSTITVRVTATRAIGRYIRITIVKKGRFLGKKVFRGCMNQGAKTKFKRRGCK
jgi:hypothetical protein